jgi:hypothetical protein
MGHGGWRTGKYKKKNARSSEGVFGPDRVRFSAPILRSDIRYQISEIQKGNGPKFGPFPFCSGDRT